MSNPSFNLFDRAMAESFIKLSGDLQPNEFKIETYRHLRRCFNAAGTSDDAKKLLRHAENSIIKNPEACLNILITSCEYIIDKVDTHEK